MNLKIKSPTQTAHKRCGKCGRAGWYRPRTRHCKYIDKADHGFKNKYLCYGELTPVGSKRKEASVTKTPQTVAAAKRDAATKQIAAKTKAIKRLVTSLSMWQQREIRYAKMAALTDDEVNAAKAKRIADADRRKAEKARRGIKIGGLT